MNINTYNYDDINRALDRLMSSSSDDSSQPAGIGSTIATPSQELTAAENMGSGTLIAQVTTASGSIPLQGAVVIISNPDGSIITTQFTDNSGRTAAISLPAPSSEYSLSPSDVRPYSTYNMRIELPGYYTEEFLNIAVFDKIESIQPVSLEPLGEDATENDRLTVINEIVNS